MKTADLFAGCGGSTTGAVQAGAHVVWAANHWRAAVDCHAANHPTVEHACQDLQQASWSKVPAHDLLLGSPSCTGHTPARGKEQPHHDAARSTAWAVVSCAEHHRPALVVVENVPAFRRWALYPAWTMAMRALGYALREHIINAADVGVPQSRERLYVVASRSIFAPDIGRPQEDRRPASDVVDWSSGSWSLIDRPGRAGSTLARIQEGRRTLGDRFLLAFYGSERGGRSLAKPLGTVTTRDRFALVDGDRMRMLLPDEYRRAQGFPDGYQLPADPKLAVHLLGNANPPPVARWIVSRLMAIA